MNIVKKFYKTEGNVFYKKDRETFLKIVEIILMTGSNFIRLINKDEQLVNFIKENTPLLNDEIHSMKTRLYWILNGLTDFPRCKECGIRYTDKNVRTLYGYLECCSLKCASNNKENNLKKQETNLKNNGVRFPAQNVDIRRKQEQTKLLKYGNMNNFKKSLQTKLERYGDQNYNNQEKNKRTKLERYGDENWNNREKANLTNYNKPKEQKEKERLKRETAMMKTYGSRYYLGSSDYKRNNYYEKAKKVMKERYGAECYTKSNHFKNHISEIQDKINKTKLKNHSFKKSKPEDDCYVILCRRFGNNNIERQYNKDIRYPFNCDFYIKSLDLFIEYNEHWTHGKHPFLSSPEDEDKIKKWESKSLKSRFYKTAIEVWTKRDVLKRSIAKQNNLNFIEFWNIKEVEEWLKNCK